MGLVCIFHVDAFSVFAGNYGPQGWSASYPECAAKNQSPVDIAGEQAMVSDEYQELMLEKFTTDSSNQTTMKNTGKTGLHPQLCRSPYIKHTNMIDNNKEVLLEMS